MSTPYASLYTAERTLDIAYKEGVAAIDQVYPDTDTYDILGQLYAPRIYGKNLTAIEVASSGIIALTMQDIHALDIDRDAPSSNVILRTVANDGLLLSLTDCNVGSLLLGNDSNVTLKAGDTASFTAGNGMALAAARQLDATASNIIISGCNVAFTSGSDMTLAAADLLFYGSNEASIQSGSNILSFTPTSGLLQTVDGPLTVSACNDLSIYTTNVSMDASSNISLVSDCNVTMLAGPNVIAVTPDTATVQSGDNLLSMTPEQATLQAGSNLFITSGATATVAASNDLFMESSGNASLTATNTDVTGTTTVTTTAPTVGTEASTLYYVNATSIDLGASNALLLTGTDITASGTDALIFQSGSNMLAFTPTTALIQSVDNAMQISACNDLAIDTQVFSLTTTSNLTVASACNLSLIAPGGALLVTPSNVALTSDSNLDILSTADMTIYSGNDLYLTAECNLVITASNLSLPLANFNLDSSGNLNMTAAGTMTLAGGSEKVTKIISPDWDVLVSEGTSKFSASPSGLVVLQSYANDGSSPAPIYNEDGTASPISVPSNVNLSGAYIVKYNELGVAQWAARINANNWTPISVLDVKESASGDIYVHLVMTDDFFGGSEPIEARDSLDNVAFTYTGNTTHMTMVIKYSSSGVPLSYTTYDNLVNGNLYVDPSGSTYVFGYTYSGNSITVKEQNGQTTAQTMDLGSTYNVQGILVKTTNGIFQWACGVSGLSNMFRVSQSIHVDLVGNVYIATRSTKGGAVMDSSNQIVASTTTTDDNNILVVKLNEQGVYQWLTRCCFSDSTTSANMFGSPTIIGDLEGNVYVGCQYIMNSTTKATVLYNSNGSISPYTISSGNNSNSTFVVKYSSSGIVQWSSVIGNTYDVFIDYVSTSMTIDTDNDIYISSTYLSQPTFYNSDSSVTSIALPTLSGTQSNDAFVAIIDASGFWKDILSSTKTTTHYLPNDTSYVNQIGITGSSIYSALNIVLEQLVDEELSSTLPRSVIGKLTINTSITSSGALYLRSGSNLVAITPSSISLEVTDAINATACNNLFTVAAASTLFTAADTLYLSASNGISFHSDSNMSLSAFSADNSLLSLTGDSQVLFWSGTNKFLIEPTFAQFGDSNSFFTLTSTGIVEQSVSTQVTAASNYGLASSDIAVNSSATLMLTSESNFTASASSIAVATPTGQQLIELDDDTGILVDSAKKILVAANDAVGAQGGMLIDGTTHEVFMASQTETNAVMSSIKCIDSNIIAFATSNQQYFIGSAASGTPILQLTASGTSTAGTQHDIFATNSNVAAITMYHDVDESVMHVLGRVDLDGAINTINKSNLDIVDKVVMFASPDSSNVDLTDGMVNDRSGIYIYGKPETPAFSNEPQLGDVYDVTQRYYEKSMIWNMGTQGMDRLGSATGIDYSTSILNESYWQLRGGNLQLTTAQFDGSNVRDTSYGFRINSRGELELYKHHWENGHYKSRKLKMWGHMVSSQFPAR